MFPKSGKKMNAKAFTLVELMLATMLGMLVMLGSVGVLENMQRESNNFQSRIADNMSWVEANRHLAQLVRSASYLEIPAGSANTLILHNYDGSEKGRYVNDAANHRLGYTDKATGAVTTFNNVNAAFAAPAPPKGIRNSRSIETIVAYTVNYAAPSTAPLTGAISLSCRTAVAPLVVATWAHTIGLGVNKYSYAQSVQQTTDEGYITACIIGDRYARDLYLVKFGSDGTKKWSKKLAGYTGSFITAFSFVLQTTDGGYAVAGYVTDIFSANPRIIFLYKTDSSGNITGSNTFGNLGKELYVSSFQQTKDGGYVIGGSTYDGTPKGTDIYVIKTNGDLVSTWAKPIGVAGVLESSFSIQQTSDGGYIIGGLTDGGTSIGYPYIVKLNSLGAKDWDKSYPAYQYGSARNVQQTADGGYIFLISEINNAVTKHLDGFYLVKVDSSGAAPSASHYESLYYCPVTFHKTVDGGYIFTGWAPSKFTWYMFLYKINSAGGREWSKQFGLGNDIGWDVQQAKDGGYVIIGYTYSFTPYEDGFIIKTDRDGNCPEANSPGRITL